jgi:hypothetical protein
VVPELRDIVVGSEPMIVDPAQVVLPGVGMTGCGTATSGLKPPLSSAVAPSGIVPPARLEDEPDSGEAMPVVVTFGMFGVTDVQLDASEPVLATPPPSNVEPDVVEVAELVPEMPLVVDVLPRIEGSVGTHDVAGLKPPGSISVAPSGTPVPVAALEPRIPSGDVTPMPGRVVALWAAAAPQPSRIITVTTHARRIAILLL